MKKQGERDKHANSLRLWPLHCVLVSYCRSLTAAEVGTEERKILQNLKRQLSSKPLAPPSVLATADPRSVETAAMARPNHNPASPANCIPSRNSSRPMRSAGNPWPSRDARGSTPLRIPAASTHTPAPPAPAAPPAAPQSGSQLASVASFSCTSYHARARFVSSLGIRSIAISWIATPLYGRCPLRLLSSAFSGAPCSPYERGAPCFMLSS